MRIRVIFIILAVIMLIIGISLTGVSMTNSKTMAEKDEQLLKLKIGIVLSLVGAFCFFLSYIYLLLVIRDMKLKVAPFHIKLV
jgi:glucose uptake protein GlcU